ncbi:Terminase small subunit [Megamonas hypermegale]|uniref:Terminase small subunit n=1 Tax=Megamonas hypermegale TaxID=158847 RepID=A0A378NSZ3_9FIRM|nr:terminase small subunit [Megamonas hypermegale]STY71491.1 Terminase small subunit [Megamonas hypermegale]DAE58469.1 MAG TPA: Terminase small subunit [Bacteriophage sp.]DAM43071.1 MAG TPA: Terminase small subunit [Caudoviricetes sp.]
MTKLTAKQERFCREYIIDLNATRAAIRAGYSEKTANRIASENLSKLDIQEKIRQLQQKIEARTEITQDKVLNELANIGFAEPSKQIRVTDKIKALELLGKHLGIFTDKLQVKGDIKTINPYENLTTEDLIKLAKNDG